MKSIVVVVRTIGSGVVVGVRVGVAVSMAVEVAVAVAVPVGVRVGVPESVGVLETVGVKERVGVPVRTVRSHRRRSPLRDAVVVGLAAAALVFGSVAALLYVLDLVLG